MVKDQVVEVQEETCSSRKFQLRSCCQRNPAIHIVSIELNAIIARPHVTEDWKEYINTQTKRPYDLFSDDGRNIVMMFDGYNDSVDGSSMPCTKTFSCNGRSWRSFGIWRSRYGRNLWTQHIIDFISESYRGEQCKGRWSLWYVSYVLKNLLLPIVP